jgi:hypothetical protein
MMASAKTPKFPVNLFTQHGYQVYSFVMTADDLADFARVERFEESSDGVNRKLDHRHAANLLDAMLDPNTLMLDSIKGDLRGNWQIVNGHLVGDETAFLSIDDGQHRHYVVTEAMDAMDRQGWSFSTIATIGLDYETRMKIFLQQDLGKTVDKKLALAMRHKLNSWKNDAEREAYNLLLVLNSETGSPLMGKIVLTETVRRPREDGSRVEGINANGLWSHLRSAMGYKSPLASLSMEKRVEVVRNLIWVAKETWPKDWESEKCILTTARGINALIMLLTMNASEFRVAIGTNYTQDNLRRVLRYGRSFKWHQDNHKNTGVRAIAEALDKSIGAGMKRDKSIKLAA